MALTGRHVFLALGLAAALAACSGTGQSISPRPSPEMSRGDPRAADPALARFAAWSETAPGYRIGEGDKLKVLFPLTPEMTQEVLVRPDGIVTLRATGDVRVADLTLAEATALLTQKALARLRNPEVIVEVMDPISAKVYVGGEVKVPGAYPISGPLGSVSALQLASGTTDTGRINEVILIRRSPDGRPMLKLVDVHGLLEGRPVDDPRIVPGDILFVPKTRIAEVGLWVEQFINRVVPFQRSFSYTLGRTTTTTN